MQILFPLLVHGQVKISNISLTDSSLSIIYRGTENYFTINDKRVVSGNYILKTSNGISEKQEKNIFKIIINNNQQTVLTVFLNGKAITSKSFVINETPGFGAGLGRIIDSFATKNEILANPFIRAYPLDCLLRNWATVVRFDAIFIASQLDSVYTKGIGNSFSKEQIELVRNLKPGDKIHFTEIYAYGRDSRGQKLRPFTIIVK
jgi:hypothetical protein